MSTDGKKTGELIENKTVVMAGSACVTLNYLISDAGGQGDVYHATFRGHDYALKWYCKQKEDVIGGAQYGTITEIYGEEKKPSEKFIWPLMMLTGKNPSVPVEEKRFGYLMELLPDGYYEMEHFLRMDTDEKAVRFKSYNAMLVAGMNIAAAMQKLHLKGWSYKDLNPKNFAIHPENGDVLVVDNDNVSVDGALCSVRGTKGYMAPEIPKSGYKLNPNIRTDYYSLATILYRLFFVDHPMDGKLWEKFPICNDKAEDMMYAIKPVFHFDPNNDSNRPTEEYAPNALIRWRAFPQEIRNLFIAAFTDGISDPWKRPPENVWITTIAKARDKLIRVNGGREQFVNFDNPKSIPPRCLELKVSGSRIALYPQKAIYEISVDGNVHQYGNIVGGIVYDKKTDKLMIRNLTDQVWRCYAPDTKKLTSIEKGQEHQVYPGVMIEFQHGRPKIVGEIIITQS